MTCSVLAAKLPGGVWSFAVVRRTSWDYSAALSSQSVTRKLLFSDFNQEALSFFVS